MSEKEELHTNQKMRYRNHIFMQKTQKHTHKKKISHIYQRLFGRKYVIL